MSEDELVEVLDAAVAAVARTLGGLDDLRAVTGRPGQYHLDVVSDAAAVEVLVGAGLGVLSEESGVHHPERPVTVVVDPVDGSTNASRGVPWYATSVCAVDGDGLRAAVVVNQASGERFQAVRGAGASCNGRPVEPSGCARLDDAIVAVSGLPEAHWGWAQFRALGAAALDLCYVADGRLDGYVALSSGLAPWDYLGALLVCRESGTDIVDAEGRPLVVLDQTARRAPVAAPPALLPELLTASGREPVAR